ncbi:uncharacterized protein LOC129573035 [Sitodiplosis mosellana]|uniref:uncharacterized protein LOC129573035 n=1 Tax=Sitodiplosis mosellana TaxID=263140 RepID=UPI002443C724|nr:uncharacterized protein LOC129573035 [Sitodiplosis mosellana]XP_055309169.1 uncharacterized protein LOC129573035 [Sitodiplosis mosellana]XP_055309170.1 uncharacterized protein LOC129573035 [Sitodiplosis mosellana]XP_055309171.1 uncharacterized protein LOC129573035 [Sitodiplosis mosellana]XP_055309172.1 uncharacterized protein LOC129573035 [Sitodiplosis mosellana]
MVDQSNYSKHQAEAAFTTPRLTVSRPTSLLAMTPEKEPIIFDANLIGAPPEIQTLVEHIKIVAERFLYHWKTFPITIPKPLSAVCGNNLFVTPPFDELDAVAMDGKTGEPKRLSFPQLKAIQERGEFEVPSQNFPGQTHRWRLSRVLQKGSLRARETLLEDLASAARLIFINAKGRLFGQFFSIVESFRALLHGFLLLIDMVIGIPSLLAHDLDKKIKEERCRYLVAELICRPEYEDCMESLCTYVRSQLQRATTEKFDVDNEMADLPIPYLFLTPSGMEVDLRLFSRSTMKKALPIILSILERERRGWFLHFRERVISELRDKKMSDAEIEDKVNEAVMQEYLQRVYSAVLSHPDLGKLGEKVPQLLVQQAQSVVIMHKAYEKVEKDIKRCSNEYEIRLIEDHPILSKIKTWLQMKLRDEERQMVSKCKWRVHEDALSMCQKHNLQQTSYFLSRDLTFMREREPVLLNELRQVKEPTRCFQWPCRIWRPKSFIIRRNFQGLSEIIPTVICQQAYTSIVMPRQDPSQPVFLIEKEIIRKNSTRWPFWRVLNMIQRIWCYTWNVMYLLGLVVPWDSPLSVRALFCIKPYITYAGLELSQINGTLFPRKTSVTQTLASRLLHLWRHVSKARTRFETEPDTGFISKGMTRAINQTWNYFFKGFIGTAFIIFIYPVLCIAASLVSVVLALTAPFWIPIIVIFLHLYMIFIYDFDCPNDDERNRYCIFLEAIVWNIGIQGCLQPILCLFVGGILCPLAATTIFIAGIVRYSFRLVWDFIMFHLFIEKCGRVPSNDSFAVKRISGPGLALNYYFSIKSEQALASLEAKMELDELDAFQKFSENFILQPQRDFKQFVEACFGPFSSHLNSKSGPYKNLERESRDLLCLLNEKLEKRRRELQISLPASVKNRIRLHSMDLKISIQHGAHLLERFYPKHVIDRLLISEDEFWDSKNLQNGDWAGLASHLYTEVFSLDFLTPLCESDTRFHLEPHPQLDLARYVEMVQSASDTTGIHGPDLLGNVFAPRGNLQINSPYLEVSAFNPRSNLMAILKKNDKGYDLLNRSTINQIRRKQAVLALTNTNALAGYKWMHWMRKPNNEVIIPKTMLNPLPLPHPVCIAIEIYNRDSDDPIRLDDNVSWDILRAVEECNIDIQAVDFVARYRGGGKCEMTSTESSIDSLDGENDEDNQEQQISSHGSQECVGGKETLPCHVTTSDHLNNEKSFKWTLSNWGAMQPQRNNSDTIRVDLASPEDISLDTDNSSRVVSNFNAFGTTV